MIENCKVKDIPIRIFHGLLDEVVNVIIRLEYIKGLKNVMQMSN